MTPFPTFPLLLLSLAFAGGCKNTKFQYVAPDGSVSSLETAANFGLKATQNDYRSAAGIGSMLTGNSGGGRTSKFDETASAGRIAFNAPNGVSFEMEGDPYADAVVSTLVGTNGGFNQAALPDVVLGPPSGSGLFAGSLDVFSTTASTMANSPSFTNDGRSFRVTVACGFTART